MKTEDIQSMMARNISKKTNRKKSTKKQILEAKKELVKNIREQMLLKKRTIPQKWEAGFMSAVSVVEMIDLDN